MFQHSSGLHLLSSGLAGIKHVVIWLWRECQDKVHFSLRMIAWQNNLPLPSNARSFPKNISSCLNNGYIIQMYYVFHRLLYLSFITVLVTPLMNWKTEAQSPHDSGSQKGEVAERSWGAGTFTFWVPQNHCNLHPSSVQDKHVWPITVTIFIWT